MNVYQYDLEVIYGVGIMLIVADSKAIADKIAEDKSREYNPYLFAKKLPLKYTGRRKTAHVLLETSYIE